MRNPLHEILCNSWNMMCLCCTLYAAKKAKEKTEVDIHRVLISTDFSYAQESSQLTRRTNRKLLFFLVHSRFALIFRSSSPPLAFSLSRTDLSRGLQDFTATLEITEQVEDVTEIEKKESPEKEVAVTLEQRHRIESQRPWEISFGGSYAQTCLIRECSNYCDYRRQSTQCRTDLGLSIILALIPRFYRDLQIFNVTKPFGIKYSLWKNYFLLFY